MSTTATAADTAENGAEEAAQTPPQKQGQFSARVIFTMDGNEVYTEERFFDDLFAIGPEARAATRAVVEKVTEVSKSAFAQAFAPKS